ncbi:MAG TPA: cytochrome c oxidase accessory protein CcoG [Bosea sp. (in: a-proteobacteria)]|jgi:cytochrome c oxidase accessory protein FixG|uniref:cytochrome c oxidase accessory protein CcoG n=1 Tax=Bosea sp. (in: a-proteobacteria) TaxID=1871050 RepID=UPI002E151293|nr:cytochrome c oxidase accessory protein CcoG [Bosea sp. (in: a-proteobacteria)]
MAVRDAETEDVPLFAASKKVYPQSVTGPYRRAKWMILALCLGIYYLLPFLRWDRGPNLPNQAVLADLANARFYFFFIELWPQEVYYFTGLLILASFVLFLMNAVAGRIWCGYLCPQTVWTDLFLTVERFFEGDRRERIKRDEGPWDADKIWRKSAKHTVWLLIAWWTGGAWVLYFADAPTLVRQLASFEAPVTAYAFIAILTFTTYTLAGIMREQVCTYMCPWPRIQAALTDDEALNVTYRYDRGDPRASLRQAERLRKQGEPAGDCVDCRQCVVVCPTGIDIRNGAQLDCIQCGLCIDACDNVMDKIGRPKGLIGYDTEDNVKRRIAGEKPVYRPLRLRTMTYAALILLVGGAMVWQLATRRTLELSVLHERAPLFVRLSDGSIRNAYTIRILNKRPHERPFALTVEGLPGLRIETVGVTATADLRPIVTVDPDSSREVRVLVTLPADGHPQKSQTITFTAADLFAGETVTAQDHFIAP